jgi:hypothetical protein
MNKFTATINGVTIPIVVHTVKKGTAKGREFLGPDFYSLKLQDYEKAFGEELLMNNVIVPKLRAMSSVLHEEALAEGKDVESEYQSAYIRMLSELSARGESMKALTQRKNELVEELTSIDAGTSEGLARFQQVALQIQKVQKDINDKKAKDEEDVEKGEPQAVAA